MWPLASTLLAGSFVVRLEEIAAAIRILVTRARVVAEGAGAASLAAAEGCRRLRAASVAQGRVPDLMAVAITALSVGTGINPDRDPWNLPRPGSYGQLLSTPFPFKGG